LIPSQGFFISKNFEHRVFEFQAWHYLFQAQSFFYSKQKRVSYFKNFEHKAFLIPSKGFFSSKILSIEFFNSKHGILLFLVLREQSTE
jgi:hypothetical protein